MNRFASCVKFKAKYLGKSLLMLLVFYFGIYTAIAALAMLTGHSKDSNPTSAFYIGGAIFAFVIATSSYKLFFNNLLMFGNTRRSMILSDYTVYAAFAVVMSLLSVASGFFEKFLFKSFGFRGAQLDCINFLSLVYAGESEAITNIPKVLLWYLAFFIMIFSFSLLFGTLAYKFGKVFLIVFWVGISLSFMIGPDGVQNLIRFVFSLGSPEGILLAPINFAVFALIFGSAAYVISTKQSQNA